MNNTEECTRANFLGGTRNVWAECLFVDPVADVAVFGEPEHKALLEGNMDLVRAERLNARLCSCFSRGSYRSDRLNRS